MAARIIIIHEKAENSFRKKAAWYYIHRGTDFVVSFTKDLWNTYETLAQMPSVPQFAIHSHDVNIFPYIDELSL